MESSSSSNPHPPTPHDTTARYLLPSGGDLAIDSAASHDLEMAPQGAINNLHFAQDPALNRHDSGTSDHIAEDDAMIFGSHRGITINFPTAAEYDYQHRRIRRRRRLILCVLAFATCLGLAVWYWSGEEVNGNDDDDRFDGLQLEPQDEYGPVTNNTLDGVEDASKGQLPTKPSNTHTAPTPADSPSVAEGTDDTTSTTTTATTTSTTAAEDTDTIGTTGTTGDVASTLTDTPVSSATSTTPPAVTKTQDEDDTGDEDDEDDGGIHGLDGSDYVKEDSYDVVSHETIQEVQADMVRYNHKKTQAEIVTLIPTDEDQDIVFGIVFRTLPESNNGAAHVLQHAVMDGSDSFPVKEPLEILKRGASLQTYLNAMTQQDRTVYAAATRNSNDFLNLILIHLDAVFHPKAVQDDTMWIYRQEAWRLERNHENEVEVPFFFNGITINQQKGVYADPDQFIHTYAHRGIFSDTTGQYDSNGEPTAILSLTREAMIEYYNKYYHPSNARVFLYGPQESVDDAMNIFDSFANQFESRDFTDPPEVQPIASAARPHEVHPFPATTETENQYHVMITWLLNDDALDQELDVAWRVLEYLLLKSPVGSLRLRLEDSAIGTEVIATGLNKDKQQWTFSVGMKGVAREDVNSVELTVIDALQKILQTDGFSPDETFAAFTNVEFQLQDYSTGEVPRGIILLERTMTKWMYGMDPKDAFKFQEGLKSMQDNVRQNGSTLLFNLIQERLIDNKHRVVVELFPHSDFAADQRSHEQQIVEQLKDDLTSAQFEALIGETEGMYLIQQEGESLENLARMPTLDTKDIKEKTPVNSLKLVVHKGIYLGLQKVKSAFGLYHVDFGLALDNIAFKDVPLIPLVARLMLETGTKETREELWQLRMGQFSGGIKAEIMHETVLPKNSEVNFDQYTVTDETHFVTKLFFRSRCTPENLPHLLDQIGELLWESVDYSQAQTVIMLEAIIADREEEIRKNGDVYTTRRLLSQYSVHGRIEENLHGIYGLAVLKKALVTARTKWSELGPRLMKMRDAIIKGHRNGMVLSITAESQMLEYTSPHYDKFLVEKVPENKDATPFQDPQDGPHPWAAALSKKTPENEGFAIPTTVSYVGEIRRLYQVNQAAPGAAAVAAKYIEDGYLYNRIKVEEGATDVFVKFDFRSGTLIYVSYRDADAEGTIDAFNSVMTHFEKEFNADIFPLIGNEAIFGTISELDGPAPQPDEIAWEFLKEYFRKETSSYRQQWRDEILETDEDAFTEFINLYKSVKDRTYVIMGPDQTLKEVSALKDLNLVIKTVAET